jgi:leucyl aminopeptidase
MKLEIVQGDILSKSCDLLVVNLFQGVAKPGGATGAVDKALEGAIATLVKQRGFEGKFGERLVFPTFGKLKAKNVAVIGLGKKENFSADSVRKIGGYIVKIAAEQKAASVVTILHGAGIGGLDPKISGQALTEGLLLGAYRFHTYHGTQRNKDKKPRELSTLSVVEADKKSLKLGQEGIERGRVLAEATILARDLVNTPSQDMAPMHLAEIAKSLATKGSGITCKILDQKTMEKLGMNAALAVARGSVHPPVGVHLMYRPKSSKKSVAIVGKAVTFDSGGLSIKPSEHMETMKIDMGGAASVIGMFKALSVLKPNVTVHGIFLAVENMPSGSAYRPGDVVEAMDGTTIEVLNTDAEGRVTLADALSYAKKQKPDMIIDLATLTGACVVALGEDIAAVLSNNEPLTQKLLSAAKESGEQLWQLPLYEPYTSMVKSKIADIKNVGSGHGGGTITAALFLKHFVGDTPWAHLDIAGPSYIEREFRPDQPYGATGYGVRLLVKFVQGLAK